ncbi:MAG: hypothetical protein GY749_02760 [Desulfobacteraceae bacterium]|nr:hypothetical protein [Desulfobacteraceae bacterium]
MKRRTGNSSAKSGIYKHPRWRPAISGSGYEITGEEIKRELKDKWQIVLCESYKADGKTKKKQWNIGVVTYWDIVDDKHGKNPGILSQRFRNRIKEHFPGADDAEADNIYRLIQNKIKPVQQDVLKEYHDSEEFYYRLIQNLIEGKKKESDKKKKQENQDTRQEDFNTRTEKNNLFQNSIPNDRELSLEIIEAGYKKIAAKYHPDTGGNKSLMQSLNSVRERLINLSDLLNKN